MFHLKENQLSGGLFGGCCQFFVGYLNVYGGPKSWYSIICFLIYFVNIFSDRSILGFPMACSNTFGLVTGAFLLGFGLSEIPKSIWRNADWITRQKVLSHKIAKMALKLDDAHQELSNAIVVAQATSKQISKRDPLRPYMDIIDNMLVQMFKEDPSFKPRGGQLGENDMDYDTDEKSMATLRCNLRGAREEYCRYKSLTRVEILKFLASHQLQKEGDCNKNTVGIYRPDLRFSLKQQLCCSDFISVFDVGNEYLTYVREALELEDTMKNYERRNATGWKFVSSFSSERSGTLGSFFDTIEFIWRCVLRKQLEKFLAVIVGCMSVAILLAEATLLLSVDLSLFSILIKSVGKQEVFVQVFAFVPLMYMCVCTYYSLFKVGMLMFYSFTPKQTSSVSLLMICSMVARYAPPISYNFLNLIVLGEKNKPKETIFEKRMGNIDQAVPFFGSGFNRIYPLMMVIYTLLVVSNFFDRVINFFGNWKIFRFQTEADDMDGFDPSGLIILQKERTWLEEGCIVGEHVVPLARNFNDVAIDVESGIKSTDRNGVEMKATTNLTKDNLKGSSSKPLKDEVRRYGGSKEVISSKYAAMREQTIQASNMMPVENIASAKVSLLDAGRSPSSESPGVPAGLASKWASMKSGFQSFKANVAAKKLIPSRQLQDANHLTRVSSSESLDEIFQRLKRPALEHSSRRDEDGDEIDMGVSRPTR
ncbi:unnamed protein product [Ilex paraguariensis]|uniref:LMBR1-like membrane protein n=1 Tax=Ilex paraguariensis TaxID=185542 RepID=A0ABC8TNT7_9AQUA